MSSKIIEVKNEGMQGRIIYVDGVKTTKIVGGSGGYRVIGRLGDYIYKADYRRE